MNYAERGWEIIPGSTGRACDELIAAAGDHERLTHPHRTIPAFMEAMKGFAWWAEHYIKSPVSGLGSYFFSVSAGYSNHTDNDYVQAMPGTFLSIWLALADTGGMNGGLVIGGKLLEVPKGSAIILDGDVVHRSCAGFGPRPVLVLTYIKKGYPFRAGREERVEVPL